MPDLRATSAKAWSTGVGPARASIMKNIDIGLVDRGFRLRAHATGKTFGSCLLEPRRIDHRKRNIAETALPLAPVARDTGPIIDQSQASADQSIEQG